MEGLVFLAGVALLLCLVVLPILVVVSLGRGSRNQRDIAQLTLAVSQLRQQMDRLANAKAESREPTG
ncbi:hypothetical protein [Serratia entomophila]|uniref:hypothetical protein n=1 Tax=Serratia entomophila TaxID=42906 RepID=UPI00217B2FAC|nr:hypothetical protein [Serratia entomophila]CAI1074256.1 Uncharacterised protein [Serratia entomophila]CAI1738443.1 Uncharacterised protein [Serratia entomophila]CAI1759192.1 Uncharacterised protein [Serratia entomophila]CAI1812609.1 Uncharacterised protein [Serratia entomophila]CAI1857464.1 Uncharacterised protein [Serratia entomophila]